MNVRLVRSAAWLSRLLTTALVVGTSVGLTLTFAGVGEALGLVPPMGEHDWEAYWNAAERLRDGAPLYPPLQDEGASSVYRYTPWLAIAWVPLTLLPREAVGVGWQIAMGLASVAALWPLLASRRRPAILLGLLFAPFLTQASVHGNVQPLLVALLVHTLDRRWGPIVIGLAASLKAFPLIYALRFVRAGQWRKFVIALLVAGVLSAPILAFDLSNYPVYAGALAGLWIISPGAWLAGAVVGVVLFMYFARTRAGWFAASVAVVMATPRLLYSDLTFLLVTGREALLPVGQATPPELEGHTAS